MSVSFPRETLSEHSGSRDAGLEFCNALREQEELVEASMLVGWASSGSFSPNED